MHKGSSLCTRRKQILTISFVCGDVSIFSVQNPSIIYHQACNRNFERKLQMSMKQVLENCNVRSHRISSERLKQRCCDWQGTYKQKSNNEMIRRIMDSVLEGSSKVGRPNLRWTDGVMEDMRKTGIVARDKQSRRGSLWA